MKGLTTIAALPEGGGCKSAMPAERGERPAPIIIGMDGGGRDNLFSVCVVNVVCDATITKDTMAKLGVSLERMRNRQRGS